VVRCCLEHAASVAKTFITSDAVVVDIRGLPHFYGVDRTPSGQEGLAKYTEGPSEWQKRWGAKPSSGEMPDVNRLMAKIKQLQDEGLTGIVLIVTWPDWRIQPLEAREHPMWAYSGVSDSTRGTATELSNKDFMNLLKNLTKERTDLDRVPHVAHFSASSPPPNVSTFVF
jgi:hypothetical protein